MKVLSDRSTKVLLIVCGFMTAGLGAVSIFPELFLDKLFKLDYIQNYDIIIRHWSATLSLSGVFLIISGYVDNWRIPIALFAILEKAYLVILCILALRFDYGKAFMIVIPLDILMCILLAVVLGSEVKKGKEL